MKAKIIITIDWFLPGTNSGGPVRSIKNLIDNMPEVSFWVITRNTDYCSDEPYQNIETKKWNQFTNNTHVYYLSKEELGAPKIRELINEVHPDLIYINGIYSKFFSILPLKYSKSKNIPALIVSRGMLSPHSLGVKSLKKRVFLLWMNLTKQYAKAHFHATNEIEANDVKRQIQKNKGIHVLTHFSRSETGIPFRPIIKTNGKLKLIILGRVAREKGTLESIQAATNLEGEVEIDIYGTLYDEEYWSKCKAAIDDLPQNIKVEYKGAAKSEDVPDLLQNYHFLFLFSRGENFGHSIAESFLVNRPVIISRNTPWKNLESQKIGFDVDLKELTSKLQLTLELGQTEFDTMCSTIKSKKNELLVNIKLAGEYQKMFEAIIK